MGDEKPISHAEWETIVANVPLVSVDLVVEHDGGVLLGKRENEPAKGEWFVPGGTVVNYSCLLAAFGGSLRQGLPVSATRFFTDVRLAPTIRAGGAVSAGVDSECPTPTRR